MLTFIDEIKNCTDANPISIHYSWEDTKVSSFTQSQTNGNCQIESHFVVSFLASNKVGEDHTLKTNS
jgi:hypothetical protein